MTAPTVNWSDAVRAVQAAYTALEQAKRARVDAALAIAESAVTAGSVSDQQLRHYRWWKHQERVAAVTHKDALAQREAIVEARRAERERTAS